jgi:hypothetical protein
MSEKNLNMGEDSESKQNEAEKEGIMQSAEAGKEAFAPEEAPLEEKEKAPSKPSRMAAFLRRALIWAAVIVVVFGLGILTAWLVRGRAQAAEINRLQAQVEAVGSEKEAISKEKSTLEADLEDKSGQIQSLQGEKDSLEAQLAEKGLQIDMLKVFVDLTSGQLALANDDVITAKASLVRTDEHLGALQSALQGEEQNIVEGMRTRLALVLNEIEGDAFAAKSDLEVLTNSLVALQRSLFGE